MNSDIDMSPGFAYVDFWAVHTFYGVNSVSWCAVRFIEFHDLVSEKGSRGRCAGEEDIYPKNKILLNGLAIKQAYLGTRITADGKLGTKIKCRIAMAKQAV
ncbi:hypothetical protein LAZ67_23000960 [Cordylochernes scorpioides]|uniref:Uncharacterized protein n=1 Tax=Cordylochernes scorpioides TaxID=51811 RepID=A0ABY6LQQ9_9ARAC|nr:hypothetical protein LAZ67_23000960 [Cordylochernes scorpioides]